MLVPFFYESLQLYARTATIFFLSPFCANDYKEWGQNSCFIENVTIAELPLLSDHNSQVIRWETKQKTKWSFKHCKATFPSSVYSRLQVTLSFDFSSQKRKSFISSQLLPRVTVHSHLLQPAIKSTLSLPEIQNGYKKPQGYFPGK